MRCAYALLPHIKITELLLQVGRRHVSASISRIWVEPTMSTELKRSPLPQMFNLSLLAWNRVGMAVYLVLASRALAISEERALGLTPQLASLLFGLPRCSRFLGFKPAELEECFCSIPR